jgi:hypothetical protein
MINHLVYGKPRKGSTHTYTPPDIAGKLHRSLTLGWWPLEIIPKLTKWKEWPKRPSVLGLYLPLAEPRLIPSGAAIHDSASSRRAVQSQYDPINWPSSPVIVK